MREMIKTAIENGQNLIVEGCYIPLDFTKDLGKEYLDNIRFICLVMSEKYIRNNFADIKKYASVIEKRLNDEDCTLERVIEDNAKMLHLIKKHGASYILIDEKYDLNIEL